MNDELKITVNSVFGVDYKSLILQKRNLNMLSLRTAYSLSCLEENLLGWEKRNTKYDLAHIEYDNASQHYLLFPHFLLIKSRFFMLHHKEP